jgi:hypothetical protein
LSWMRALQRAAETLADRRLKREVSWVRWRDLLGAAPCSGAL